MPEKPTSTRFKDIEGKTFGRWTVKKYNGKKGSYIFWLCECTCGVTKSIRGVSLRLGGTKSCGCLRKEMNNFWKKTHGMSNTPEFRAWVHMKQRCKSKTRPEYKYYKNLKISKRWNNFENFLEDMGKRPSPQHSIDRIDNSKGYFPSNCRWATKKQQSRNQRSNRIFSFNGKSQCTSAWAEDYKMNLSTLFMRLKRGWSFEKAITIPVISSSLSASQKKLLSAE